MLNKAPHFNSVAHRPSFWIAVALLLGAWITFAQSHVLPEGAQPYVPTRLEWLALELNSTMREDFSESSQFSMAFIPNEMENTVVIYVTYIPSVQRIVMNKSIETAKKIIDLESKTRGWSSWLKVQERVEMKDLK